MPITTANQNQNFATCENVREYLTAFNFKIWNTLTADRVYKKDNTLVILSGNKIEVRQVLNISSNGYVVAKPVASFTGWDGSIFQCMMLLDFMGAVKIKDTAAKCGQNIKLGLCRV